MALGGIRTVSDPSGANASVSSAVVADRFWQVLPVVLGARDPASALALARSFAERMRQCLGRCGEEGGSAFGGSHPQLIRHRYRDGCRGCGQGCAHRATGGPSGTTPTARSAGHPCPTPVCQVWVEVTDLVFRSSSTITIESVALLTDDLLHHAQGRLRPRTLGVIAAYRAVVISDYPVLVGGSDFICKALSACFQMSSSA